MANDPLAEVVTLLQPAARFSKLVEGAGAWRVQRAGTGEPFYCAVLEGGCRMIVEGQAPTTLEEGDVVLVPAMHNLVVESLNRPPDGVAAAARLISRCHFRVGDDDAATDYRAQLGHGSFGSPDAELLVSLLPQIVIARREPRLAMLLQLIGEETLAQRSARDLVLERLLEVMLIEALRSGSDAASAPGLARGLNDERLATAIRVVHARPGYPWTVEKLATEAALSRSAFFARFHRMWVSRPWSICWHGAWRLPSGFCAGTISRSSRLQRTWVIARPVPSPSLLLAMSVCPRRVTHAPRETNATALPGPLKTLLHSADAPQGYSAVLRLRIGVRPCKNELAQNREALSRPSDPPVVGTQWCSLCQ
jgi:hypothetical protein